MTLINYHYSPQILISLFFLCLLGACKKTSVPIEISLPTVTTKKLIQTDSYQRKLIFTGEVMSINSSNISFELMGKINEINVDIGDKVIKGQALAQLDTRLLKARRDELLTQLEKNNTRLNLSKRTLTRSSQLNKKQYLSKQKLDELREQQQFLLVEKERLDITLYTTLLELEKATLKASFDGTISHRFHDIGDVVSPINQIFTLNDNHYEAHIGIPIQSIKNFTIGDTHHLSINGNKFNAEVIAINNKLDQVTHTIQIRFKLPNQQSLYQNEIVTLSTNEKVEQPGFWVPLSAIVETTRGLWNLYIVNKTNNNVYSIESRNIDIIYSDKNNVFVTGDIAINETYIDKGSHKFIPHQKVLLASHLE